MQKTLSVIFISLCIAFAFNFLFFDRLIGISFFIFSAVFLGALYVYGTYERISLKNTWWLVLLILFFALMPAIRANEFLIFLNVCAVLGLSMILAYEITGTRVIVMRVRDYVSLGILVPFQMLGRALSTIAAVLKIHSDIKRQYVWIRIAKGVLLAIPVLILFGVLFSQADLAFSQFLKGFVDIQISEYTIQYFIVFAFAFITTLSFFSYVFFPKEHTRLFREADKTIESGRGIEVAVFLGLIGALFLLFIGFQIAYLFGGEANIAEAGFTYAEYARRGFWELLAVVILSLLVLFGAEKYVGREPVREPLFVTKSSRSSSEPRSDDEIVPAGYDEEEQRRWSRREAIAVGRGVFGQALKRDNRFLIPALILITEVGVVVYSACTRLALYIDAYGMTLARFYAAGLIALFSVLFVLLGFKFVMLKREEFFAFGTVLSIAGILIAINLINPDAFVAKMNMRQYERTGKIDVSYLSDLSSDAEFWNIELYKKLEGEDRETLRKLLEDHRAELLKNSYDWQSRNLSRLRALESLGEFKE